MAFVEQIATYDSCSGEVSGLSQVAPRCGMPSDLIMNVVVHAFDDIYFSALVEISNNLVVHGQTRGNIQLATWQSR